MAKSKKNKAKGRSRRHNINGKNSGQGRTVTRVFQYRTQLTMPTGTSAATGSINWFGVTAEQDFTEMADLYSQCRITKVVTKFLPMNFVATVSPLYNATFGCVAHDPTSTGNGGYVDYSSLAIMPRHKLFAGDAMGGGKWTSLTFTPRLVASENFGNQALQFAAGEWGSTAYFVNVAGGTFYGVETQTGAVNSTVAIEVLQVIHLTTVEFRQPIADRGSALKVRTGLMKVFPRVPPSSVSLYPQSPTVLKPMPLDTGKSLRLDDVDEKDEKDLVVVEKKEQPRARSLPPARATAR
jgi:hypothetical protein